MSIKDAFVSELHAESLSTIKILERVPMHDLVWKPHEKSMTIGRLATHIAENLRWIPEIISNDVFDFASASFKSHVASSSDELLSIYKEKQTAALAVLQQADDALLNKPWSVLKAGQVVFETSKKTAIRSWALSHLYHHRGQLSVYLRLLDIPVPGLYGPSADEK